MTAPLFVLAAYVGGLLTGALILAGCARIHRAVAEQYGTARARVASTSAFVVTVTACVVVLGVWGR